MRYPESKDVRDFSQSWYRSKDNTTWRSPADAESTDKKAFIDISFPIFLNDPLLGSAYYINFHYGNGMLRIPYEVFQAMMVAWLIISDRLQKQEHNSKEPGNTGLTLVKGRKGGDPSKELGFAKDIPDFLGMILLEYPFKVHHDGLRKANSLLPHVKQDTRIKYLRWQTPNLDLNRIITSVCLDEKVMSALANGEKRQFCRREDLEGTKNIVEQLYESSTKVRLPKHRYTEQNSTNLKRIQKWLRSEKESKGFPPVWRNQTN